MQPKSIDTIASNIGKISTTASQPHVTNVTTKFTTVLNLFGTCYRGYNSSTYMDDEDIKQLGKHDYIYFKNEMMYQTVFHRTRHKQLPGLLSSHISSGKHPAENAYLEGPCRPMVLRWCMGFGIMGEQGAESIHAYLMKLERIHQGIANDVERLKYIFKEHQLESAPSLVALRSSPQKQTKENLLITFCS